MVILGTVSSVASPDRIILVKQYRPPVKGFTIEMPAGLVDPGEGPEVTALRELKVDIDVFSNIHTLL